MASQSRIHGRPLFQLGGGVLSSGILAQKGTTTTQGLKAYVLILLLLVVAQALALGPGRAIVICPDKPYVGSGLPALPSAKAGAKAIAGQWRQLPNIESVVEMNSDSTGDLVPNSANIPVQIESAGKDLLPSQLELISIQGHGIVNKNGEYVLVTSDGTVSMRAIAKAIEKSRSSVLVYIEMCRPGNATSGASATQMFPGWSTSDKNIVVIYSTPFGTNTQFAGSGLTTFAKAVISTFSGEALDVEDSKAAESQSVTVDRLTTMIKLVMSGSGRDIDVEITKNFRPQVVFFAEAKNTNPKQPSMYLLALNTFNKGDVKEAEALAREAIKFDPSDALLQNLLGLILEAQGRHEEAIEAYDAGIYKIEPSGEKKERADVLASLPIIVSNKAIAYQRMMVELGDKAPANWKEECKALYEKGITAEGFASAYSLSNMAMFCETILQNLGEAEDYYVLALRVGKKNSLACFNAAAFFKSRFLALEKQDSIRAKAYLQKAVTYYERAHEYPDVLRKDVIQLRTALALYVYQKELKQNEIATKLDYRELIDDSVDTISNPTLRAQALDIYQKMRGGDFPPALARLEAKLKAKLPLTNVEAEDFHLLEKTYQVRAELASTMANKDFPPAKRPSLLPVIQVSAAVVRLSNEADAAGLPMPTAKEFTPVLTEWKSWRKIVLHDIASIMKTLMDKGDFSNAEFIATEDWATLMNTIGQEDDSEVVSYLQRANDKAQTNKIGGRAP